MPNTQKLNEGDSLTAKFDPVGNAILIHIEYDYLKQSDLSWIFSTVRVALRELKHQEGFGGIKEKVELLIHQASTGNSLDIEFLLITFRDLISVARAFAELRTAAELTNSLYKRLKHMSGEKRFTNVRRHNISKIKIKKIKRSRKVIDGKIEEEVEEEFELELRIDKR